MIDNLRSVIDACLSDSNSIAWRSLIGNFGPIAINILNRKFRNLSQDEKEDVVQNCFLKLIKGGLQNFRGTSDYEFLAYFKRIVVNEANTYLKSVKSRKEYGYSSRQTDQDEEDLKLEIPDNQPLPNDQAEKNELTHLLQSALNDFPLETKEIFLMKAEGYKDKDVADILGIPMGTVASTYSRIKEKMKRMLGE